MKRLYRKEKIFLVIGSLKKKDLSRFRLEVSGEEECDLENIKCL